VSLVFMLTVGNTSHSNSNKVGSNLGVLLSTVHQMLNITLHLDH